MLIPCTRCDLVLDSDTYFQPPITICLLCYSRIPKNRDLDVTTHAGVMELRQRALKSKAARLKRALTIRHAELESFVKTHIETTVHPPKIAKTAADVGRIGEDVEDEGFTPCDRCKELFDPYLLEMRSPTEAWCRSCIQQEDEREGKIE